jgi:hypothetical protein
MFNSVAIHDPEQGELYGQLIILQCHILRSGKVWHCFVDVQAIIRAVMVHVVPGQRGMFVVHRYLRCEH